MSRSTDTRERTRAVANELLAQGYAPSEVTVDRIYGEIRQGSRTTIHDELRLWRSEQRQQHQVVRDAPEAVRLALQTLWSGAVTEAGQQWASEREALQLTLAERDAQLDALQLTLAEQQQALDAAEQRVAAALADSQQWQARHQHLTQELDASRREQAVAQAQIASLNDTLAAVRHDAQAQSVAAEQRLRETVSELRAEAAAQATAQQAMLDTATHRLESVQRSMLLQLEQTRSEQREAQAVANQEASARQQAEAALHQMQANAEAATRALAQAERECQRQTQAIAAGQETLARVNQALAQLQAQRDTLESRALDRDALLAAWQDRAKQAEQHLAHALLLRHEALAAAPPQATAEREAGPREPD